MNIKVIFLGTVIIVAFWAWLLYSILTSSMSYNSLSPALLTEKKVIFKSIFPEGFSFFTRDPREPQAMIFTAKSKEDLMEINRSSLKSFFGFSRYGRALTIELGIILSSIQDQKWFDCYNVDSKGCFENEDMPIYYLKNSAPNPLICGEFFIKITEPVPWAWSSSFKRNQREMPYKIVKVFIECDDED